MNAATVAMVRASGRSWWVAHYRDGKELPEWHTANMERGAQLDELQPTRVTSKYKLRSIIRTPLTVNPRTTRWEEVSKDNLVGLALVCPNGKLAVIEANRDHALFQLKTGGISIGIGGGGGRTITAHVIGAALDDGSAHCWAYEYAAHPYLHNDDAPDDRCRYCNMAARYCSGATQGVVMLPDGSVLPGGRLVEFIDSFPTMQYMRIGLLNLDVQGVRL